MSQFDEEFDFVVVGSGGGSMCAALVMRQMGKTALVLEKTELVGGTTARSGGVMWVPNNRFMAEEGIDDSPEQAMAYMEATAGTSQDAPGTSYERRAAYVSEAPRMIDFLVQQGIELRRYPYWPDYYDDRAGGSEPGRTVGAKLFNAAELGEWCKKLRPNFISLPGTLDEFFTLGTFKQSWAGKRMMLKVGLRAAVAKLTGKHWVTAGAALQGRMLQRALAAGVAIRTETPVQSFIVENGAVKGVITQRDRREWRVGARLGVLVNAGGFAHNQAMLDQHIPGVSAKWTGVPKGDTGEMIQALMALGAATGQMEEMVGNQMSIPPGKESTGDGVDLNAVSGQMSYSKPHAIVVDQTGVRYMNECGSYMEFCQNVLKRNREVPAIPSWWIADERCMASYMFCGLMPGGKKPQEWYDAGFVHKADTIEELAAKMGADPATLHGTIDRFNDNVRAGQDRDFNRGDRAYDRWLGDPYNRPHETLGTIEQGPFYATTVVPGNVGTYGGVVTDVNARVLREDGSPIPGLYATGTTTASVMGRVYPGAGSSIGPSFTWGFVAAKHASGADNSIGNG